MKKTCLLLVLFALFLSGCWESAPQMVKGDETSSKKVLIASDATNFKKEVVTKVVDALVNDGYFAKVIGLDDLKTVNSEQFGAIVIVNPLLYSNIDSRADDYIKANPEAKKKIILFVTAGIERSEQYFSVDAVTGASVSETADSKANEIVSLVKKRF
jgi:menaquinone-dependent protoporphyrinogen IX oxidase